MTKRTRQQRILRAAVMVALLQLGTLGCGHVRGRGQGTVLGSHRVIAAHSEGAGRYRLISERDEEEIIDLRAGRAQRVRKGTVHPSPTGWYAREWNKDRSQRRSDVSVGRGERTFNVLGGRLLGYRDLDGSLIESPRLTYSVGELAFIVPWNVADSLLVAAERSGDLALVELRLVDLSVMRELLLKAHPGEGLPSVLVAGDRVFVTALTHQGLCVRTVRRSDLTLLDEFHLPVGGPDAPEPGEQFTATASADGRWLVVQLVEGGRVLVIDAGAGTLDEIRLRHDAVASMQMEGSFLWAIGADLKTVHRWDFAAPAHERTYSLTGNLLAALHDKLDGEYGAEHGRVANYPLAIAFDRRGLLLVAEWDGHDLRLSEVQERKVEVLLRVPLQDVEMVHIDVDADALVVIGGDGSLVAFDLSTRPIREQTRLPAE